MDENKSTTGEEKDQVQLPKELNPEPKPPPAPASLAGRTDASAEHGSSAPSPTDRSETAPEGAEANAPSSEVEPNPPSATPTGIDITQSVKQTNPTAGLGSVGLSPTASREPASGAIALDEPAPEIESKAPQPSIRLEKKHPLAIRWMHWINFPVLFTMIWSGLLIYWNDSDNAYLHPHAVYRIGLGKFTLLRFFPEGFWKAINAPYHVTQGLGYHFFFMWIFLINGFVYVLFTVFSGEWRFVVPNRESLKEAIQVTLVDLHLSKKLPPQTKYNGAQKIAYTTVILMGAGSLITGLAIYKPTQAHWLTTILGGYEMARWEHFWLMLGFCGFFVVHVTQVVLAGWNNFRSMVSGLDVKRVHEPSLEAERRNWG